MTGSIRHAFCIAVAAVLLGAAAVGDVLYLRDGEQLDGRLVSMNARAVVFEGRDGAASYPKREVLRVQLQRARQYDDIEGVDQIVDADLKEALAAPITPEDFPTAGYVTILERTTYDMSKADSTVVTTRLIAKVLQQSGEDVATQSVWYFEDTDEPHIDYALTVTPDGRVLHLSDAALKNESLNVRLPAYRRLARFRFACKEPRPGSIIDVQYTVVRKRGGFLDPTYGTVLFGGKEPLLQKEVRIITAKDKPEAFRAQLEDAAGIVEGPETEELDGKLIHAWHLAVPRRGIAPEPHMPPLYSFVPRLTLGETADWEAVGGAYAAALTALPPLPENWIAKAKELAEEGGAEAIRNHVARNVRLVNVPPQRYRMVPCAPGDALERGLANQLDKDFVFLKMLEAAGIDASFALVRGRGMGGLPEEVPSLKAFNRSAVYLAGEKRFVSAASDTLSYKDLPGALQGVPAFVVDGGKARLERTQALLPEQEWDQTHFAARLQANGDLEISVTLSGLGSAGKWLRGMKDLDDQGLRNRLQAIAGNLHPAAVLVRHEATDFADLRTAPSLTLQCSIPAFGVHAGEDIMMFELPAVYYDAQDVGRPTRVNGLYWGNVRRESATGTIALPAGWRAYSLPENVAFGRTVASYRAKTSKKKGVITFEDQFDRAVIEAPAEAYGEYKECIELRARVPRQRIILRKR